MVGGLGHCGQELCCKRLGRVLPPCPSAWPRSRTSRSTRRRYRACAAALCAACATSSTRTRTSRAVPPSRTAQVETPAGMAKVVDLDVPREIVSLKVEGEKPVRVPLADFEPPDEGRNRPNRVGRTPGTRPRRSRDRRGGRALHLRHLAADRLRQAGQTGRPCAARDPATAAGRAGGREGTAGSAARPAPATSRRRGGAVPRRWRPTGTAQPATTEETPSKRKPKQGGAAGPEGQEEGVEERGEGAQGGATEARRLRLPGPGAHRRRPAGRKRRRRGQNAASQGAKGGQGASKQGTASGQRSSGLASMAPGPPRRALPGPRRAARATPPGAPPPARPAARRRNQVAPRAARPSSRVLAGCWRCRRTAVPAGRPA